MLAHICRTAKTNLELENINLTEAVDIIQLSSLTWHVI